MKEVKSIMEAKRIDIFGLNETKIKSVMQDEIRDKFGQDWKIHTNSNNMETMEGDSIWF